MERECGGSSTQKLQYEGGAFTCMTLGTAGGTDKLQRERSSAESKGGFCGQLKEKRERCGAQLDGAE